MALTARHLRAIEALMTERTYEAAAERVGVHRNTLRKWLQDAQFCTALHTVGDERIAQAVRRLSVLSGEAVDTLSEAMRGADSWPAQIRAADLTLVHAMRLRELHELEPRIAALEAQHGSVEKA